MSTVAEEEAAADRAEFRRTVLSQYRCPFLENLVDIHQEPCPFSHTISRDIISLPGYLCLDHLLTKCLESTNSVRYPSLVTCSAGGVHLTLEDMVNLEEYELTHARPLCDFAELHEDSAGSGRECSICLDRILSQKNSREFGILEHCDHCFCAPCIKAWQKQDPSGRVCCPICRTVSTRIVCATVFVESTSGPEKRKLFA